MERKILIAYENRQYPIEIDITERNKEEVEKVKEVLRRVGRTWKIKDSK